MVLMEHRGKMLYPRFEHRFAADYESRYDALFSTMGPAAAIRQRAAMGYRSTFRWMHLEGCKAPLGDVVRLSLHPRFRILQRALKAAFREKVHAPLPAGVQLLTSAEARRDDFFSDYWDRSREAWAVSPRRNSADLCWRFWDNPYADHYAVIVRGDDRCDALVVFKSIAPGAIDIVDFSAARPEIDLILRALKRAVTVARKHFSARLITCSFTEDAIPAGAFSIASEFQPSLVSRFRRGFGGRSGSLMPRRITPRGVEKGVTLDNWGVTSIVAEGRS